MLLQAWLEFIKFVYYMACYSVPIVWDLIDELRAVLKFLTWLFRPDTIILGTPLDENLIFPAN